jgi:hypothetical protein
MVMTETGPAFVTKVDHSSKSAWWNKEETPLELGEYMAKDLALGLCCNMHSAFAVCHPVELDHQPYLYSMGHLEWVGDKKNDDKTE